MIVFILCCCYHRKPNYKHWIFVAIEMSNKAEKVVIGCTTIPCACINLLAVIANESF